MKKAAKKKVVKKTANREVVAAKKADAAAKKAAAKTAMGALNEVRQLVARPCEHGDISNGSALDRKGVCKLCGADTLKETQAAGVQQALPGAKHKPFTLEELTAFAVFRDINGIVYLRVGFGAKQGDTEFIVNKGFEVVLITMPPYTVGSAGLNLTAVAGASVYTTAKRLLTPLNDQVTITRKSAEMLQRILTDERITEMETAKKATATKKFATVTAPGPKGSKKTAEPAAKKTAAKKAASTGEARGRRAAFTEDQKLKANFNAKEPPYREGTARMELLTKAAKSKTVGEFLKAAGEPTGGSATAYLSLFVKAGFVAVT